MTITRYPDDCSAECSEMATWDVTYMQVFPPTKKVMSACDAHRDSILRAAMYTAVLKTVKAVPHV